MVTTNAKWPTSIKHQVARSLRLVCLPSRNLHPSKSASNAMDEPMR